MFCLFLRDEEQRGADVTPQRGSLPGSLNHSPLHFESITGTSKKTHIWQLQKQEFQEELLSEFKYSSSLCLLDWNSPSFQYLIQQSQGKLEGEKATNNNSGSTHKSCLAGKHVKQWASVTRAAVVYSLTKHTNTSNLPVSKAAVTGWQAANCVWQIPKSH